MGGDLGPCPDITNKKIMIRTISSNSGVGISDNIYYAIEARKNGLLGMKTESGKITLYFRDKDNSRDGSETIVLSVEAGKEDAAAEAIAEAINGISSNAQAVKLSNLTDNIYGVDGVFWTAAYASEQEGEDLEVDPNAADITAETVIIYLDSLPALSGPYRYEAYIGVEIDDPALSVTTAVATGEVTADESGLVEITMDGYYTVEEVAAILPETVSGTVNTAYVTLTNDYQSTSVSIEQVLTITHPEV